MKEQAKENNDPDSKKSLLWSLYQKFSGRRKEEEEKKANLPPQEKVETSFHLHEDEVHEDKKNTAVFPAPDIANLQKFYNIWRQEKGWGNKRPALESYLDTSAPLNEETSSAFCQLNQDMESTLLSVEITEKINPPPKIFGKVNIFISKDQTIAWAFILPPLRGGTSVAEADIQKALLDAHVTFGIDHQAVLRLTEPESCMLLTQIAKGKEPKRGRDGKIEEVIPHTVGTPVMTTNHDIVNYRDLNWLVHVEKDEIICKVIQATKGESGMTVLGEKIPAQEGKMPALPKGSGTYLSENGTELLAQNDGQIFYEDGKYHVTDVITIENDVDLSTGNIDVKGNVFVRGNVRDDFWVKATGDINISGSIGAGTVIAGKNLFVGNGINGNNKGHLEAGKDIKCRYIENAFAKAGGSAYADSIINSTIVCGRSVMVESGQGAIAGGSVTAMTGIQARVVGNERGIVTRLNLEPTPEFTALKTKIANDCKTMRLKTQTAEKQRDLLQEGKEDPEIKKAIEGISFRLSIFQIKLKKLQQQMDNIMEQEKQIGKAKMKIEKLYPIAVLRIHGMTRVCKDVEEQCLVFQGDNDLQLGKF